jgi:FemAB-related protein (PEP-CTERM system-associated)
MSLLLHPSGAASIAVTPFTPAEAAEWDAFVLDHPDGTVCHRAAWSRILADSFGYRTHSLIARVGDDVAGVLPLTEVKSRLFGHRLVSSAFCVYGGPLAANDSVLTALTKAAQDIADRLGVENLEYRSTRVLQPDWAHKSNLYVTYKKALPPDPDKVLESCPPKRRNKVRKGLKGGLIIENGDSLDRHYEIYAESVRNLGTPVFPKRYFANILAGFGKDAEIITVNHRGRPLAVALQLYFRDEATPYYTGRSEAGQSLNAFDVLTYACMRRAAERGVRVFDFGRSKRGTGAFEFKDQWGFEPTPLPYEFWLRGGNALPDTNPLNPKYRLFIAAWRRLPLGLANRLGPMIVGGLG